MHFVSRGIILVYLNHARGEFDEAFALETLPKVVETLFRFSHLFDLNRDDKRARAET